ncbi:MAG: hypothetical protein J6D34_01635 [Atopobiaceae bacterium]|nr:hypothetical protein [Atopobiaceae bacterium]
MKSPLRYQVTEADCGKTSFVNALMYLFEREEIPPQAVDFVTRVTGDCNLGVNGYMRGTSAHALAFMAAWCNDYLVKAGVPIRCQALSGDEVIFEDGSPLVEGLRSGAVAVCGCCIGADHYVLMVGLEGDDVLVFDPYYDTWPPQTFEVPDTGVAWVDDKPFSHNRKISRDVLNDPNAVRYSLFAKSGRDAVLVWRDEVPSV